MEDTIELYEYKSERSCKTWFVEKRAVLLCSLIALVFAIAFFIALGNVIWLSVEYSKYRHEAEEPNHFYHHLVKNTTEYQIDLHDKEAWANREQMTEEWIENIQLHLNSFSSEDAFIKTSCRLQTTIDADACDRQQSFSLRVRSYISGTEVGMKYIDIKGNDEKESKICVAPFLPANKFLINSAQKCEHDVHECSDKDKYSRESRIFFTNETFPDIQTCRDVAALYPSAIVSDSEEALDVPVETDSGHYWWVKEYAGYLNRNTRYEMAFTLEYHNREDALQGGVAIKSGEWSIRIHTKGNGFSDHWSRRDVRDITSMYKNLTELYGEDDCD